MRTREKRIDIVFTHIFPLFFLVFSVSKEKIAIRSMQLLPTPNHFHLFIPSHPVNLSISLTGGKEIKRDVPSNGE
jgi:hypothetical protein